jgi:YidC/Oxa1 family membrane protein insertase
MLKTASELRFAQFFWIQDLSVADTVGFLCGLAINPMPLLMAITMFVQMQITPNAMQNGAQKYIFKLMPFLILFCCYRLPSGLTIYWTAQNVISILQQAIINRHCRDKDSKNQRRKSDTHSIQQRGRMSTKKARSPKT